MKKLLVVAALAAMLFQSTAFADTPVSASHEQAARELIELLGLETQMRGGAQDDHADARTDAQRRSTRCDRGAGAYRRIAGNDQAAPGRTQGG